MELYFRHSLIHTYSSEGQFDIDHRRNGDVPYRKIGNVIHINPMVFISYLEKAFDIFVIHLREAGSDANLNAIENSMYHPVLVDTDN